MPEQALLTIQTDGASRGNPGAAAFAYVISRTEGPTIESAGCLGQMTNNQAEYTALVRALEHALTLGPEHRVLVRSDSELMVKQMKGEYKVKNEELRGLYEQARRLAARFTGGVSFLHVRREQNKRADQLCNNALDGVHVEGETTTTEDWVPDAPTLDDEALACLERAGARPDAAAVWKQLVTLLTRHGVRLPTR